MDGRFVESKNEVIKMPKRKRFEIISHLKGQNLLLIREWKKRGKFGAPRPRTTFVELTDLFTDFWKKNK